MFSLFNTVLIHPNNNINASNFILSTRDNIVSFENCQADKTLPDCDFDGDGKLNRTDSDDDNDGVVDGNDTNPYNPESDSDGDGTGNEMVMEIRMIRMGMRIVSKAQARRWWPAARRWIMGKIIIWI